MLFSSRSESVGSNCESPWLPDLCSYVTRRSTRYPIPCERLIIPCYRLPQRIVYIHSTHAAYRPTLHDTDPYLSYYPPFSLSSILHPLLSCIFLKAFPFIRIDSDPFPVSVRTANECCALALKRTARFQSHSNRLLVIERLRQLRQPLSQPKIFASAMSPLMLGPFVPLTLTLRCQCLSVPQLAVVVLASSFVSPPSAAHELQLPHSEP